MKFTRLLLIFCLVAALAQTLVGKAQPLPTGPGPKPVVTLSTDSVTLEWRLPVASLTTNAGGDVEVRMDSFETENMPGAAKLPYTSVLVALPPQAVPVLQTVQMFSQPSSLPGSLARVPAADGNPRSVLPKASSASSPLVMEEIGMMRGVRLARITLHPVLVVGGQLEMIYQIQATLRFNTPASDQPQSADPLVRLVQEHVVNPSQVQPEFATKSVSSTSMDLPSATASTAIIEVNQTGFYQVTYAMLLTTGFPVDQVNPLNLKLSHGGSEVAYEWTAAQDSSFRPGESFRFYAQPRFSRWSVNDTYLLSENTLPGKSITLRSAVVIAGVTPGKAWTEKVIEQNLLYTPDCLGCNLPIGRDGDRWAWDYLARTSGSVTNPFSQYSFTLEGVDPAETNNQLTLWLIGGTDLGINPDHKAALSLNGISLGDVTWQGKTAVEKVISIPSGVLSGTNSLKLELPGLPGVAIDGVWLDAFKLRYRLGSTPVTGAVSFTGEGLAPHSYSATLDKSTGLQAYDVTDPLSPVKLKDFGQSGAIVSIGDPGLVTSPSYLVFNSAGVLSPAAVRLQKPLVSTSRTDVDYLIIQPEGYDTALASLVTLRTNQGLQVAAENIQSIYDHFNDGRLDPDAIHNYLADAYTKWHPKYVLLVGDGSVDPKHYLPTSNNTVLPPYLKDVDPYTTDSASDNRFVTVQGNDNLPEMMLGRLPANSPSEAAAMVNKIVQYETAPVPGLWRGVTTFISDNKDAGGDFQVLAQNASLLNPGSVSPQRLFFGSNITNPAQMHTAVMDAWNRGSALIMYSGHSSVHQWAVEDFFHFDDVAGLTNGMKLPVVLEMTCLTGTFDMVGLSSLDEELIRKPAGGAIAVWGSTSEGISTGHEYLAAGFIRSLTKGPYVGQLGMAAKAGQINLATFDTSNQFGYLIDSFILFGDPATHVALQLYRVDLPLVSK